MRGCVVAGGVLSPALDKASFVHCHTYVCTCTAAPDESVQVEAVLRLSYRLHTAHAVADSKTECT